MRVIHELYAELAFSKRASCYADGRTCILVRYHVLGDLELGIVGDVVKHAGARLLGHGTGCLCRVAPQLCWRDEYAAYHTHARAKT